MSTAPDLPPGLTEIPLGDQGLRGWQVDTPACTALVSRQGGQVLRFQARGRPPLLWLSPLAQLRPGKAIRGGIPLCFPWFGPHPADPALPAHGFARLRDWRLAEARRGGDDLHLVLALDADAASRDLWPHDFQARLHLHFGRELALRLEVRNSGDTPCRLTFAFHSYFPLGDVRRAHVEGLAGSTCIDQLAAGRARHASPDELRFVGETDRIYLATSGECRLVDELSGDRFELRAEGCRSVVAWNPGPDKTLRLGDMPPAAWQGMACVESGNVEDDAVVLAPGTVRQFGLRLASSSDSS